ncbi:MAG: DNA methyltransferase [Planctomycetota bacterium]|nr:DNA methyltransferase [Planctomycetota bacterium]
MPRKKPAKPEVTPPPAAASPAAGNPAQPVEAVPEHPHKGRPSPLVDTRVIYCGDNLEQLKKLPDACIDLIYIDPPFNSNRNYEVFWGETREKRAFDDRHASTQAYIEFMRPRCVELARVLKKTGSFYYHCDWHAGHYIKVMLDQLLGENNLLNEIIWKRTHAHGSADRFAPIHDTLFFYHGGAGHQWNPIKLPHDPEYIEKHFKQIDEITGRRFQPITLTGSGIRKGASGLPWRGVDPTRVNRHWAIPGNVLERYKLAGDSVQERLNALDDAGLVYWPRGGEGVPRLKWFADELEGAAIPDVWTDIPPISANAAERLGYPTQKPLALLERIIKASSKPNDIILDAFCGCGTALVAAENLGRQWIGIDISPTACRVMAKRLRDVCHLREDENLWRTGRGFVVRNLPWTEDQLRKIPPFEFENWAVIALGGVPNKTQVGDHGIDGRIYPISSLPRKSGEAVGELAFMDVWYPIQVKQKDKVGRPDIDSFEAALQREKRTTGFFVAFDYSSDAMTEIGAFFKRTGIMIRALTVKDILEEQIARKLA